MSERKLSKSGKYAQMSAEELDAMSGTGRNSRIVQNCIGRVVGIMKPLPDAAIREIEYTDENGDKVKKSVAADFLLYLDDFETGPIFGLPARIVDEESGETEMVPSIVPEGYTFGEWFAEGNLMKCSTTKGSNGHWYVNLELVNDDGTFEVDNGDLDVMP